MGGVTAGTMRPEGAAPGWAARYRALSLVLAALMGQVTEGRGIIDNMQRLSSLPPYLPVSLHVLRAETSFFLKEATPDLLRNASLQSRVESFFTYKARQPPVLNASYGPYSAEKIVPLDLTLNPNFLGPTNKFPFDWRLKAYILRDKVYLSRPKVQVLFHIVGRDWDDHRVTENLPCLRVFAFRDTREVRGSCRLGGALGLCVAQLEMLPGWFSPPTIVSGRRRPTEQPEGNTVELYYTVHSGGERGDCTGGDTRKDNAIRQGKDGQEDRTSHLQKIGSVGLYRTQDSTQLSELRLDGNVVIWLPSQPVKQGDIVTASVTISNNSTVDHFILRAKVKKGVNILTAQTSEPRQWNVRQEVENGGKHTTTTVACQRLGPGARHRSSNLFSEVMQMNFEIASFSSLSGTQPITWQVEYPRKGTTDIAVSEIFISQKDLVAIVPLAMDTELLNTAVLTGKTVAMPVRVVSVEENSTVRDISELVECKAMDEDVIKVSDHCDYVFVNGKEIKGKVDSVVNFTYQHLSAPLHVTVWVPRLPLQIEVSDTELSQVKGWRVPIVASKRPTRDSEEEEEEEQRGRGCALQFQHATVLSPLSDSILAEKTVTVLDDKVSVTDLAVQVVAGLSVTLHPISENNKATTAVVTAEELLRAPKQEAIVNTWLQFSDGSVTPLDIYDTKDFSLTATSLDEAVLSIPQPLSPWWPIVVAEGEGQGPLLRVDMSIAEACQKSKRKSVLAVGIGHMGVKFGWDDTDSSQAGDKDEEEIKNHASDRRQKTQDLERPGQDERYHGNSPGDREEGALLSATTTAKSLLDNKVGKSGRLNGARLHSIPIDFTNFPAHVDLPKAGSTLEENGLMQTAHGLSDLEIGMYALLGVFCLAILVFLINCATFAFKYRHKQVPLEGQASMTHSHDWVWLGNEAELLENIGDVSPPQDEHTTIIDRGLGVCEESNHLLLNGGSQKHMQSQVQRPPGSGGRQGRELRQEPANSPTSKMKKVKFATFTVPPEDSCPTANPILSSDDDIKWVCQDLDVGTSKELRTYLEKFQHNV
ncbi:transmembrane protein 132C isoform X2 [Mesocricetus auratus]|uniref:Transmembrane protein 132C isoform X2 n=1 Tax=Mesocricetus auratus TaxID=10036 RepID=A0A1U8CA50_MESAU|nr:transmembrane protein 132C isoform X2 [Mesocricetus auratus]